MFSDANSKYTDRHEATENFQNIFINISSLKTIQTRRDYAAVFGLNFATDLVQELISFLNSSKLRRVDPFVIKVTRNAFSAK